MEYEFSTYDSIADVPAEAWERLRVPGDMATDPRLIRCVEEGLAGQGRCWVVVARDAAGAVAAGACLVLMPVDAGETMGPVMRRLWPKALRFGVLFCGMPAPSGDGQLRFVPGTDIGAVLRGLDRILRELAGRHGAGMVVIKELDDAAAGRVGDVASLGYLRGDVPAVYVLRRSFADFNAYCGQLRPVYRRQITRSVRKVEGAGFCVDALHGSEIADQYTDEYHRLYEAVWARAAYRLERWPADFFRGLARRFGDQASMTRIRTPDGLPAAWVFGLTDGGAYHNLYAGIDYSLNEVFDLYFNLYFFDMDRAFREGAKSINMGQTAELFKARLGADPVPLCFFARGVRPWVQWGLRAGRRWAFPPAQDWPAQHVFRDGPRRGAGRRPGLDAGDRGQAAGAPADVKPRPSPRPRPGERKA